MFKAGQEVIVAKLFSLEFDGAAKIVKLVDRGENKGKWLVECPSGRICVSEDRLTDAKEYWRLKNGRDTQVPVQEKRNRKWGP